MTSIETVQWGGYVLLAYAMGAIPFAFLIARLRGIDIRLHGSGNVGATNVGRVLGPCYGVIVFVFDVAKGSLPVYIAAQSVITTTGMLPLLCGIAAILGHTFPVYLKFKGGKGVATACGVFFYLMPIPTVISLFLWGLSLLITRYISASSIVAAIGLPITFFLWYRQILGTMIPEFVCAISVSVLIVLRHASNVRRLVAGTEHKMGTKE